jgi:catechol-2,3-dioxygenase
MAQETAHAPAARHQADQDFMPLNGVDHVELYVGNALQAAYYYTRAFGFRTPAWRPARATACRMSSSRGASAWS